MSNQEPHASVSVTQTPPAALESGPQPGRLRRLALAVVVVIAFGSAVTGLALVAHRGSTTQPVAVAPTPSGTPAPSPWPRTTWAMVSLHNNQIFYGHVKNMSALELDLVNVYYTGAGGDLATSAPDPGTVTPVLHSLVRDQIQCPTDEIIIERAQVVTAVPLDPTSPLAGRLDDRVARAPARCFVPQVP